VSKAVDFLLTFFYPFFSIFPQLLDDVRQCQFTSVDKARCVLRQLIRPRRMEGGWEGEIVRERREGDRGSDGEREREREG
jgi:hypothetical protein